MAFTKLYDGSPKQISSSLIANTGNCLTSICTESLNICVQPKASVKEIRLTFPLKFGVSVIGIPSGIKSPLVSKTKELCTESSSKSVNVFVRALLILIESIDSSYLQIGLVAIKSTKISLASLTVAELSSWQPLASTIVKGYVPENKFKGSKTPKSEL